jgi:putative transposase
MPRRTVPFISEAYYHIFNRGVEKRPIFIDKKSYTRFLETLTFYQYLKQPLSLSNYFRLSLQVRKSMQITSQHSAKHVSICCYALMPNHFHILAQQTSIGNISMYLRNISDSYTRYFNSRNQRVGSLFQGQFKAVRIESDEQLIHVARYIHLNPYTAGLINKLEELRTYPWTSLPLYLSEKNNSLIDKQVIQGFFQNQDLHWKFILDQAEYQKKLDNIKHLLVENPDMRS